MIPMKRINIELTPEELELALTLAKQAGCKSIEDFFRLTLARATEGKSGLGDAYQLGGSQERLKRVHVELGRLHKELRGFLSESALASNSNPASAGPFAHGPTHPRIPADAGSTRQEGAVGSAPQSSSSLNAPAQGQPPGLPGAPNIQLGYDRRAPGFKFKAEDELEDMASAAFKNSPQLGFASASPSAPANPTKASEHIKAQIEESGYIEELIGEELLAEDVPATEQEGFVVSVSIDSMLAGLKSEPIIKSIEKEEGASSNEPVNSLADKLVAVVAENPVETEPPAAAQIDAGASETTEPVKEEESEGKTQNADGEIVSSEVVKPDQIKPTGISGNLPPRKRKT
jgi:hypothetical protein